MIDKVKIITIALIVIILLIPSKALANTVEYRGESEGLIIAPNDFFLEFGELLPGDKKSDKAYIKNITKDKIEVFFKTEPLSRAEYYDDIDYALLDQIMLRITLKHNKEKSMLYEGTLRATSLSEYISLGEYDGRYDGELEFEIEVPQTLKNEYTLSQTQVKWVFYVEKQEQPQAGSSLFDKLQNGNVKTGDYIGVFVAIMLVSVVVALIGVLIKSRHKENK